VTSDEDEQLLRAMGFGSRPKDAPPPRLRIAPLFEVLDDLIDTSESAASACGDSDTPGTRFEHSILTRGILGLKSARLLLEAGFWEYATPATRQLFELLVNMEHINSFSDRAEAIRRYNNFAILQHFLSEIRRLDYAASKGSNAGDQFRASIVETLEKFGEFRASPKADGTPRWKSSWSGKNTRALAELSPNLARTSQYDLLFSAWSEQAHGSPGVFFGALWQALDDEEFYHPVFLRGTDHKIAQTLGMAIILFVQLWGELPVLAKASPKKFETWTGAVEEFMKRRVAGPPLPISE
jgi:hypothetical protein